MLNTQTKFQFRRWPWSCEKSEFLRPNADNILKIEYTGSPFLELSCDCQCVLPKRQERFAPHGPSFEVRGQTYHLHELPHGILANRQRASTNEPYSLMISGLQGTKDISVSISNVREFSEDGKESELARIVNAWSHTFDELLIYIAAKQGLTNFQWEDVINFLELLSGNPTEPRMALIVHLAEMMNSRINALARMARKILLRERQMIPAERISETDMNCLRWYIRQPGNTMQEKAASNRRNLLGITRRESFDTLENRVFKDFLLRCEMASSRYLKSEVGEKFQGSKRALEVKSFRNNARDILAHTSLGRVSSLTSRPEPNYVLLNDTRYRDIWHHYKRLLKDEDERDKTWDWQGRLWADICRMLFNVSIFKMVTEKKFMPLYQSSIEVLKEQNLGSRIMPGCEPGPFLCSIGNKKQQYIMEIVHSEEAVFHRTIRELGRLGAHMYLMLEKPEEHEKHVFPIWGLHTAASNLTPEWEKIGNSAQGALTKFQTILEDYREEDFPRLYGFIIASSLNADCVTKYFYKNLTILEVPADPQMWYKALTEIADALHQTLQAEIL